MEQTELQLLKRSLIEESKSATQERKKEILMEMMEISLKQALIHLEEKFSQKEAK